MQDLRHGLRTLRRNPGFALITVLTLAIGIGANTVVFSVLDQVLLRMLPVKEPERLVFLSPSRFFPGANIGDHCISYPAYRELRDRNDVFEGLLCRFHFQAGLGCQGRTERTEAVLVSGNYFPLLGVKAALGRTITPEDDRNPGAHPAAVISYAFWQKRFGSDPQIVGRTINLNGRQLTVVGVAEPRFDGVELGVSPAVWVPVMMTEQMVPFLRRFITLEAPATGWVQVFGRLKPGVDRKQAEARLAPLYHSILAETIPAAVNRRDEFLKSTLDILPGQRGISLLRRMMTTPLWALMAMVAIVLLIACVNVAGLMIGRGVRRRGELALRMAIGAGRRRLVRQLLSESLMLALLGGGAGILMAGALSPVLVRSIPVQESTLSLSTALDWRVLGFCLLISLGAAVGAGLIPALCTTQLELVPALKHQASAVVSRARLRRVLLVGQVALSLLLLTGALLLVRSFSNLAGLDAGIRSSGVVSFSVDPTLNGYPRKQVDATYHRLKEQLENAPGLESVALGMVPVLGGSVMDSAVVAEGYQPKENEQSATHVNVISEDFFRTLGIHTLEGRDFRSTDSGDAPLVGIINESFAHHFFGKNSPLGRHVGLSNDPAQANIEVVGVVADSKYEGLRESMPRQLYVPFQQSTTLFGMTGYVRSSLPSAQVATIIRRVVQAVDPALPVSSLRTLDDQRARSLATERLLASLAGLFAVLATLLAALGLYGLLSYSVASRRAEIGLRMALGARISGVIWLVLREVLLLCAVGIATALPVMLVLGRLIESQLYGVAPRDPWMMGGAMLLMLLVSVLSGVVPARRAARVDPMQALREE
ncbi:MAG: ABC transporter permease [Acidobacteriota bacterium]